MRKLILVLAFAFVCAVSFAQMQQGTIGPRPVPVNQGGTAATTEAAARTSLGVYSTDEVDEMVAAGELLYYRTASSSDVAGMLRWATSSADLALAVEYSSATSNITTNGVYYLTAQVITPAGYPGITSLRQGTYTGMTYAYVNTGNRDLKLETELWICDSAGTEKSFVATGSEEDIPATVDGFAWHINVAADVAMDVTDRLLVKYYIESNSGTTNTRATFYTGGSKTGYFGIPVSRDLVCTLNTPQTLTNKTLDNDTTVFNGSSTQVFQADEIRADTYRSAAGASTGITLSSRGCVTMARQSCVVAAPKEITTSTGVIATATFDSDWTDALGEYNDSTGVFTALEAGTYLITVWANWTASAGGTYRSVLITDGDGSNTWAASTVAPSAAANSISTSRVVVLAVGGTLAMRVSQDSGGNLNCWCQLSIARLQ